MLITGVAVDRTICYPLRNPEKSTLIDVIDDYIKRNVKSTDLQISVKRTLIQCYQNESIYNYLNLQTKFDIDNLQQNFDVAKYLDKMQTLLDSLPLTEFTILNETNANTLKQLSSFEPSINFDRFQDEVS